MFTARIFLEPFHPVVLFYSDYQNSSLRRISISLILNSGRADARGSTVSGSGMLLHRGQQLSTHPLELLPSSPIPQ